MIAEQVAEVGRAVVIYDAERFSACDPRWFDADYYRTNGAVLHSTTGRGGVLLLERRDETWVLRHYHRGGFVAKLVYDHYLWTGRKRNRAFREWRLLAHLHALGLPAPRPIAARVVRAGLTYSGDLITERLPAVPCSSLMAKGALDAAGWRAAGACVARCHRGGLDHADLTLNNLLLGRDGTAHVIDLDRAVLRAPGPWASANLARLKRSLIKLTPDWTAADRDAAWRELMAGYSAA